MNVLALDIGGANIKASNGSDFATSLTFPLWQRKNELSDALCQLIGNSPPADLVAVTMTGELADCYESKHEGVRHIADATISASGGHRVVFYLTTGQFVEHVQLCKEPQLGAASNWRGLASYCLRLATNNTLLVDVGSTTCDVIPLVNGKVATVGVSDMARLNSGELVYLGVERTAVGSLIDAFHLRDSRYPVARELFATTMDAHLILGHISEEPNRGDTADGRPRTKAAAERRLAKMICADAGELSIREVEMMARQVFAKQRNVLRTAITCVADRAGCPSKIILSGHGNYLAESAITAARLEEVPQTRLSDEIGSEAARCAPAFALAVLAREAFS